MTDFNPRDFAQNVLEANIHNTAIAARVENPFGHILVFSDVEARDTFEEVARPFSMKGAETVEYDNSTVTVAWGQLPL